MSVPTINEAKNDTKRSANIPSIPFTFDLAMGLVADADALVIVTGTGMGVDSGLGTFRGNKAYTWPGGAGMSYTELCSPDIFNTDPDTGYRFWEEMIEWFQSCKPHAGYHIIKNLAEDKRHGAFIFSTNIDGYWDGIMPEDRIYEAHGSTKWMQCILPDQECSGVIWKREICNNSTCIKCHYQARPNVLMFNDQSFDESRWSIQKSKYENWLDDVKLSRGKVVVLEIGAGVEVRTGRAESSRLARMLGATVIRVNPEYPEIDPPHISAQMGALTFLEGIKNSNTHDFDPQV